MLRILICIFLNRNMNFLCVSLSFLNMEMGVWGGQECAQLMLVLKGGVSLSPSFGVQLPSELPENTRNSVFPVEVQTSV